MKVRRDTKKYFYDVLHNQTFEGAMSSQKLTRKKNEIKIPPKITSIKKIWNPGSPFDFAIRQFFSFNLFAHLRQYFGLSRLRSLVIHRIARIIFKIFSTSPLPSPSLHYWLRIHSQQNHLKRSKPTHHWLKAHSILQLNNFLSHFFCLRQSYGNLSNDLEKFQISYLPFTSPLYRHKTLSKNRPKTQTLLFKIDISLLQISQPPNDVLTQINVTLT